MKFYIKSFGCQYNEWDAARLSFALKNIGLIDSNKEDADIIFLLNCSVRKTGVDRVMGITKNFIKQEKKVILSGCILEHDRKIFEEKGAIIWNNENLNELKNLLKIKEKESSSLAELLREGQKVSNYIPIIKGCNNFCSYCAVPYTRGREVSRPVDEIMDDVKNVIAAGHKEIWLLGQNVNSYRGQPSVVSNQWSGVSSLHTSTISSVAESQLDKGQMPPLAPPNTRGEIDSSPLSLGGARGGIEVSFAQLLKLLSNIPGDFKIYFTSNHPKDMSYEIIEAIANLQKVAKSIHFPLQSGSNKILKAMNRPYTKEKYLEIVNKIKDRVPGVKLTTDTIIGFPGETEEDFQETVDLFKKINFHQAYNNKYSPRSGTAAFKLGDPIPWSEKQRRWKILNEMVNK